MDLRLPRDISSLPFQIFSEIGETHWTLLVNDVNRHVPEVWRDGISFVFFIFVVLIVRGECGWRWAGHACANGTVVGTVTLSR